MSKEQAKGRQPVQPDPAELARRVQAVEDMMIAGYTLAVIKTKLAGEFNVTPRTIHNYYLKVLDAWKRERKPSRDQARARLKRSAQLVYRKAVTAGKFGAANTAIRTMASLDGIPITDRIEHSGPGGGPIPIAIAVRFDFARLTNDQLRTLIDLARAARVLEPPGAAPAAPVAGDPAGAGGEPADAGGAGGDGTGGDSGADPA